MTTPRKKRDHRAEWERRKRAFEPDALDLAILKALPDEGSKLGRYLSDGVGVKSMPGLIDPSVKGTTYAGRISSMAFVGLVTSVKGAKKEDTLWQRTAAGKALVEPKLKAVDGNAR